MKKFSTPSATRGLMCEDRAPSSPRKTTLAFLRQFARAYCPAPAPAMPGFVLN